jgi:hypothetical protein
MKNYSTTGGIILAGVVFGSTLVTAQNTPAPQPQPQPPRKIVYKAAAGAAPAVRLTGGSRGAGDELVRLDVLAPDETGLTTQEQPSLFWYQSRPAQAGLELTLLEEGKVQPLLQVKMDRASQAGIQRVKLADHGVKLQLDVEYRWVVALVLDRANRSKDLVASGFIKRVRPSGDLEAKLSRATPAERPAVYAEEGIWHDALTGISELAEAHPNTEVYREQRADLLRQAGLALAADGAAKPAR